MNAPYQRINVPTAEIWNSASQNQPTSALASDQQAPTATNIAPLLIQPPGSLVAKAPLAQSMPAIQTNLSKSSSRLKPWLVAGTLLVLLATAATVFAEQEQEVGAQLPAPELRTQPTPINSPEVGAQLPAPELRTQPTPINSPEQYDMNLPYTQHRAKGNSKLNARTNTVGANGASRVPVTTKLARSTKTDAKHLLQGETERLTKPHRTNNQVIAAPVDNLNSAITHDQPQLDLTTTSASMQQGAKPQDRLQTTLGSQSAPIAAGNPIATDSTQNLDTRSLALLALGVAGAGAVASVGLAISARRTTLKMDKFKFEEFAPTQMQTPPPSTKDPVAKTPLVSQRAAVLAYIDQSDWAAALERTYGVNTRPGPHNALVSLVGARNANEDYGCAYELNDAQTGTALQCVFVADGCGGHNGGREASCLAVRAASEAVLQAVKLPPAQRVQTAFGAASAALIRAGRQWDANSLRTTLIVVLADESNYYCGWIGDGGIDLHRENGQWEGLLIPHKSGAQNLLAASLGPDQVGEPSYATHARLAGDRLYVGSDGVFDVYIDPSAFWGSWFEGTSETRAPQTCLTELLAKCAEHTAFDDNMTVAYLHTPAHRVTAKPANPTSSVQHIAPRTSGRGTQPA